MTLKILKEMRAIWIPIAVGRYRRILEMSMRFRLALETRIPRYVAIGLLRWLFSSAGGTSMFVGCLAGRTGDGSLRLRIVMVRKEFHVWCDN